MLLVQYGVFARPYSCEIQFLLQQRVNYKQREKVITVYQDTCVEEKVENQKLIAKLVRKQKAKKRLILTGITLVMVLIILCVSWFSGRSSGKQLSKALLDEQDLKIQELEEIIRQYEEEPIVVNPVSPLIVMQVLESELGEISELATYEYLFTDSTHFSDSKQIKNWNIPFTKKSFTMKWDGIIKAGVNLDQIKIEVHEEQKKILVILPKAEILSYDTDENSVEVLDEKSNLFNPIKVSDKVTVDAKLEEAMKARAIENGLLEKAQENAEKTIYHLLSVNPDIQSIYSIEFVTAE